DVFIYRYHALSLWLRRLAAIVLVSAMAIDPVTAQSFAASRAAPASHLRTSSAVFDRQALIAQQDFFHRVYYKALQIYDLKPVFRYFRPFKNFHVIRQLGFLSLLSPLASFAARFQTQMTIEPTKNGTMKMTEHLMAKVNDGDTLIKIGQQMG